MIDLKSSHRFQGKIACFCTTQQHSYFDSQGVRETVSAGRINAELCSPSTASAANIVGSRLSVHAYHTNSSAWMYSYFVQAVDL